MTLSNAETTKLLTPQETAAVLNINPRTLRRWVERGLIGRVELPSGHHRFRAADVEAIIEGRAA